VVVDLRIENAALPQLGCILWLSNLGVNMAFVEEFWSIPVNVDEDGKSPLDKYVSCLTLLLKLYKELDRGDFSNDSETFGYRVACDSLKSEILSLRQRLAGV
jgi:hypothetical protein